MKARSWCTKARRGGCRRSSFRPRWATSRRAMCRSNTASRDRTTRSSPPAPPACTRSATPSRLIALGDADVMVAGGSEATVCELGIAGFCASRALSTGFNDTPAAASRPWDKDRDGFVMGEGSGCVVLEEYEHATQARREDLRRGVGYGMSGDAYHITAPAEGHDGAFRAMRAAMRSGGVRTGRHPVCQRARHLHAAGRRPGAGGGRTAVRRRRRAAWRCRPPSRRPAICWARPARSRRSSRSWRSATVWRRRR